MGDIRDRLVVHCPARDAARYIAAYMRDSSAETGCNGAVTRTIRVFADKPTTAEPRLIASLYPLQSIRDPHPTYSITWQLAVPGALSEFAGALTVERCDLDDGFTLAMYGHYEEKFDAVLRRPSALSSARSFLETVGAYIELAHARDSAARAGALVERRAGICRTAE